MKGKLLTLIAFGVVVASTTVTIGSAGAAVVSYNEATDGDIAFGNFNLDVGTNTISGTSGKPSGVSDYDDISFVVAPGMQLVGLTLTATLASGQSQTFDMGWEAFTDGFGLGTSLGTLQVFPPGTDSFSAVPLAEGDYFLFQIDLDPPFVPNSAADYTLTFVVRELQAVPEPATLALLSLGLAGLGFSRRRTQN